METLTWLQHWYEQNCDGEWEHMYGVKIQTIDNPGWYVEVDIVETDLEHKRFDKFEIERHEQDWCQCFIKDGQFRGAGGAMNLEEILLHFQEWAVS